MERHEPAQRLGQNRHSRWHERRNQILSRRRMLDLVNQHQHVERPQPRQIHHPPLRPTPPKLFRPTPPTKPLHPKILTIRPTRQTAFSQQKTLRQRSRSPSVNKNAKAKGMHKRMGCKADGEVKYRSNLSVVRILTSSPTRQTAF